MGIACAPDALRGSIFAPAARFKAANGYWRAVARRCALGCFPAVSVFMGGIVEVNFGPERIPPVKHEGDDGVAMKPLCE